MTEGADCSTCNRWPPREVSNEFKEFILHLDPTDREGLRGESEMQLLTPNPVTFICLSFIRGIISELARETSQEHVAGRQMQGQEKREYSFYRSQ